jgi:branched-chain amino acid transport system permease protein
MFLGCGLAAAAGALTGAIFDLTPFMGGFALMKGIGVIIMGGLGSIPGAIIGGLILGLIDGVVTPLLSVQMANIIGLIIIILILLFRPQGLLGHE